MMRQDSLKQFGLQQSERFISVTNPARLGATHRTSLYPPLCPLAYAIVFLDLRAPQPGWCRGDLIGPTRGPVAPSRGPVAPSRGIDAPSRGTDGPTRRADGPSRGIDGPSSGIVGPTRDLVSPSRRTDGPTRGGIGPPRGGNGPTRGANRRTRRSNQKMRRSIERLRRPEGRIRSRIRPTPRPDQRIPRRRARSRGANGRTRVRGRLTGARPLWGRHLWGHLWVRRPSPSSASSRFDRELPGRSPSRPRAQEGRTRPTPTTRCRDPAQRAPCARDR